ncbi:hypothetical protein ACFL67_03105 [candidate division KSB1 bacterium]
MDQEKNTQFTKKREENPDLFKKPREHFFALLKDEKLDEAFQWYTEKQIPKSDVLEFIQEIFEEYKKKGHNFQAIELGKQYLLDRDLISPLYYAEWNRLSLEKEYEEAAKWAKAHWLSDVEIERSAMMAFKKYSYEGNPVDAVKILNEYNLEREKLHSYAIDISNKAGKQGDFYTVAILGEAFHFSKKRTCPAAVNAVIKNIKNEEFEKANETIQRFELLDPDTFEHILEQDLDHFARTLSYDFIEPVLNSGKLKLMHKFLDGSNLLFREYSIRSFQDMKISLFVAAVKAHNQLLAENNLPQAVDILNTFQLLAAPIPYKDLISIIAEALNYHKKLLQLDNLKDALKIKNDYMLFTKHLIEDSVEETKKEAALYVKRAIEKKNFKAAQKAIEEYEIPPEMTKEAIFNATASLINKNKFSEALNILNDFKMSCDNTQDRNNIKKLYNRIMDMREYLWAAEYGKQLKMKKDYIEDAAFGAWHKFMETKKYEQAEEIFRRYKIPKNRTKNLSNELYRKYLDGKDFDMAVYIRNTYKISLSLYEWIVEFFRIVLNK